MTIAAVPLEFKLFNKDVVLRFWTKVDVSVNCWDWTSAMAGRASANSSHPLTPQFTIMSMAYNACDVAFMLYHSQKIPEGYGCRSTCGNPKCVNPDHLEIYKRRRMGSRRPPSEDSFAMLPEQLRTALGSRLQIDYTEISQ